MSTSYNNRIDVDDQQLCTIVAALRYWQEKGMCEPSNRSDWMQELATAGDTEISMDDTGIDELIEHLNAELTA